MVKKLFKRLEDIYVAVTFAEAGEFESARQVITEGEIAERKQPKVRKIIRERLRDAK